jgi:Calcineurin-like phosphoesterase
VRPNWPLSRTRTVIMVAIWVVATGAFILYANQLNAFKTAPPPQPVSNEAFSSAARPNAPAELWALGDGAAATRGTRAVAARIKAADPARVLYLGDVYESGSPTDFAQHFRRLYGSLLPRTDPTPGNHEWPSHRAGYDPFWRSVTHQPTPPWYSLEIGGWRLLSLNGETPGDPAQVRWLKRKLATRTGTCTLAFWHRPRFSAGPHGDQGDIAPLWDRVRGHAALVLNGHDHDFQLLGTIAGITEIVAGAGGRSHYKVNRGDRRLAFANDRDFGALRVRLRPGSARLAFIATDGRVLDRSLVRCR